MATYKPRSAFGEFLSNAFGVRGRRNAMAWVVAGGLAYYWYVVPVRQRADEQKLARDIARQLAEERQRQEEAAAQVDLDKQT